MALPTLQSGGVGGSIIITSSTAGLRASAGMGVGGAAYTAAKTGLVGLMKKLAVTLAPESIRVNSVHPTGVNTPMIVNEAIERMLAAREATGVQTLKNLLPVEMVEPVDVSNAVLWLVSDAARYVTGVTLPVDAGFTIR